MSYRCRGAKFWTLNGWHEIYSAQKSNFPVWPIYLLYIKLCPYMHMWHSVLTDCLLITLFVQCKGSITCGFCP